MEWAINYLRKGAQEEAVVILPSILKLVWWIVCNAWRCEGVIIVGVEKEERDVSG